MLRAGVFVANWQANYAATAIKAFSLKDGRELGTVANLPQWPSEVAGPHRAVDGSLWYTITTGPRLRNGTAGGDPAPNSCTGSVVRFDPATGKSRTVIAVPVSVLIGDAVPSPDGSRVAYLAGGCDTSFFNMHIVVRELATGREWTIGARAKACHLITTPSWSGDGSKLTFTYEPSTSSVDPDYVPHGTCEGTLPGQVVIASSGISSELTSPGFAPAAGCGYTTAAFDAPGLLAVEACGDNQLGSASLIQLDISGRVIGRFDLHQGSDPTTLASTIGGSPVLVNEYQAPEDSGDNPHGAFVWIQVFDGHSLRTVARYDGSVVGLRSATF